MKWYATSHDITIPLNPLLPEDLTLHPVHVGT